MIHRFVIDNFGGAAHVEDVLPEGPWQGVAIGTCSEHDKVFIRDVPQFAGAVQGNVPSNEQGSFSRTAKLGVGAPLIVPPGLTWRPVIIPARDNLRSLVASRLTDGDAPDAVQPGGGNSALMVSRLEVILFERACDALAWPRHRAPWEGCWTHQDVSDVGGVGSVFVPFAGRRHAVIRAIADTATTIEVRGLSSLLDATRGAASRAYKELVAATAIPSSADPHEHGVWHVGGTNEEEAYDVLEVRIDAGNVSAGDVTVINVEAFGELGR